MSDSNEFKLQSEEYAAVHYKNAAGVVPKVEKNGDVEVFQYPDKPDGKRGMRGFRVSFSFGEAGNECGGGEP